MELGWIIAGSVVAGAAGLLVWRLVRRKPLSLAQVQRQFRQEREHLEARFFQLALATGKPRGLRWVECQWGELLVFARDRPSGRLTAIVDVTIRFEAIPGSDME